MGDGSLSQEEIDALLMGADDVGDSGGGDAGGGGGMDFGMAGGGGGGLSPSQQDILSDSFSDAMQTAGTQAASLVGKDISITNPTVEEVPAANIGQEVQPGSAIVQINMGQTATVMAFPADAAKNIAMNMMGSDSAPDELDEAHLSTLSELTNTIVSSLSKNLSDKFSDNLTPSAPDARVMQGPGDVPALNDDSTVKISYNLSLDGQNMGKLVHYIAATGAQGWVQSSDSGADMGGGLDLDFGQDAGGGGGASQQGVPINPVNFPSMQPGGSGGGGGGQQLPPNFELLLDVQMVMTVELGRTRKYVKDILGLGEGSIIELDKLAGEPVDLLVNGKLIAKGEVVVIDENFGVRVTDIVGPAERLARMSSDN